MAEQMTFIREDLPPRRARGGGYTVQWETRLAPLKEEPGQSFRVWTFTKKSQASARRTAVTTRLRRAVPNERWDVASRVIEDGGQRAIGIYVTYLGEKSLAELVQEDAARTSES